MFSVLDLKLTKVLAECGFTFRQPFMFDSLLIFYKRCKKIYYSVISNLTDDFY